MPLVSKLIYGLLGLVIVLIIGMLTSSWRLILYPYVIIIGLSMLFGILKSLKQKHILIFAPVLITLLLLILFLSLDIITVRSPFGGSGYVLGMTPSIAIVLLGIWPTAILVTLAFRWTFGTDELGPTLTHLNDRKNLEQ